MTFLNPLILIGLAAAAIPLIIHLFNFRRPQKVDFSSLAFLKELQKSTMQRVRIKQLLLLALRMLTIACLAMAFARPTLTGNLGSLVGSKTNTSLAIVIDNSRSMQLRDAGGAYFDQAKEIATALIDQTTAGDEIFILPTAQPASSDARSNTYTLSGLAIDAIADLDISPATSSLLNTLNQAADQLEDASHLNKEIYLISDLQQQTFADTTEQSVALNNLTNTNTPVRTYLIPIGEREQPNIAITDIEVISRIIEVGQPAHIEATLINYSPDNVEGYVASVFLEGERVAQATADLPPGVPQKLKFTVTPQRRGWLSGVIQTEDDAFDSDNSRYFTLNVPAERNLLIVKGDGQRTDYLELALSPELTRSRVAFKVDTIEESDLALQRLGTYDAVILAGLRNLSSGEIATLRDYQMGGGGILFFPSESAQAQDYNALLQSLEGGSFSGFSGSRATPQSRSQSTEAPQTVASLGRVDFEHPVFEGVFEQQQGLRQQITVESPLIYYTMNYTPASGLENTLIQLSNGFPFLQEIRAGQGSMLAMAIAPDPQWSDLPQRGLFIPLIYRCVYYLSAGESLTSDSYVIGLPGEIRLPGQPENTSHKIISPQGEEFVPEQRNLLGTTLLEFSNMGSLSGIYDVMAGEENIRKIAVNLDAKESDLSTHNKTEAIQVLNSAISDNEANNGTEATNSTVRLLETGGPNNISRAITQLQEERTGRELWNVFLLLALIFMIAEMLVAKQWRPETAPAHAV